MRKISPFSGRFIGQIAPTAITAAMIASPIAVAAQDTMHGTETETMQEAKPEAMAEPAQDAMPLVELSPEQQLQYDSWPPEQRALYDSWPGSYKSYYWTLTPERQSIYFRLSEDNRAAIDAMDDAGRMAAWNSVEAQLASPPQEDAPLPEPRGDMPSPPDVSKPR